MKYKIVKHGWNLKNIKFMIEVNFKRERRKDEIEEVYTGVSTKSVVFSYLINLRQLQSNVNIIKTS